MARSRTTVGPGNQLAVRHGAYSPALIEERMAQISARIDAELEQVPYLTAPDGSLVRSYKWLTAQAELGREWLEANGGMYTPKGALKAAAKQQMSVVRAQMEVAKVLGLGAVPRAQVARDMANAGRDLVEVKAAQERLKKRLRVVNGE